MTCEKSQPPLHLPVVTCKCIETLYVLWNGVTENNKRNCALFPARLKNVSNFYFFFLDQRSFFLVLLRISFSMLQSLLDIDRIHLYFVYLFNNFHKLALIFLLQSSLDDYSL